MSVLAVKPIVLPDSTTWPIVAATREELERLRTALLRSESGCTVVRKRIDQANIILQKTRQMTKVEKLIPPEGSQHIQWYNCRKCQLGLQAIDTMHHRCPQCGDLYSGYPYDNVLYKEQHKALALEAENCAWAFALTGNFAFARWVHDILVAYAKRYAFYPYHSQNMGTWTDPPHPSGGHIFEQTLSEADWILKICNAYDLVRLADVFTDNDHRAIREDLLYKVYENLIQYPTGKSNWQTYHNAAFIAIGALLGDTELVTQALVDPQNGFFYQIENSFLSSGMWYENSWGYHFYIMAGFQAIHETARRLGIDLCDVPQLHRMYAVPFHYLMPDGNLPRFGDDVTHGIPHLLYESAYSRWKDPEFLSVLPPPPTWGSVFYGRTEHWSETERSTDRSSIFVRGSGHAILRVQGRKGETSAVLQLSPFESEKFNHGHFDRLSFVFYGLDRELGVDPGRAARQAYNMPIHEEWYKATISHNTVMVDRASQTTSTGELELFFSSPILAATVASTNQAYVGINHRRLLVLRPDFLLVADWLEATDGREHLFDWMYHNVGDGVFSDIAEKPSARPSERRFSYIDDIRSGSTNGVIKATFKLGTDVVELISSGADDTDVLLGTGVGTSVKDRVPLIFISRRGKRVCFATVIEPVSQEHTGQVLDVELREFEDSGYEIVVGLQNGTKEIYSFDYLNLSDALLLALRQEADGSRYILAQIDNSTIEPINRAGIY